jgi:hypothetical protein
LVSGFSLKKTHLPVTGVDIPNDRVTLMAGRIVSRLRREAKMAVVWQKDVDAAVAEAKASKRPLLIDFSAAPQ